MEKRNKATIFNLRQNFATHFSGYKSSNTTGENIHAAKNTIVRLLDNWEIKKMTTDLYDIFTTCVVYNPKYGSVHDKIVGDTVVTCNIYIKEKLNMFDFILFR